ncbi:hypothetical protein CK623_14200 [Vandammella animalimorsus]|uniref:Uncharacterized protein n=1 Tax=Vandammella animalimorsus TaxID=2029117 RepID=A0A2A2AGG2_9BURK|nr:hypothetical protein CK623_14200 [Vandammella animalimorsus]
MQAIILYLILSEPDPMILSTFIIPILIYCALIMKHRFQKIDSIFREVRNSAIIEQKSNNLNK